MVNGEAGEVRPDLEAVGLLQPRRDLHQVLLQGGTNTQNISHKEMRWLEEMRWLREIWWLREMWLLMEMWCLRKMWWLKEIRWLTYSTVYVVDFGDAVPQGDKDVVAHTDVVANKDMVALIASPPDFWGSSRIIVQNLKVQGNTQPIQ